MAEAVRIAREIAAGLAAAHETGLVHRDIKPGNVWLEGKTRRVKLLDFGLARAAAEDPTTGGLDAVTQTGAVVGTPAYMSPEQAHGQKIDARSDLFSLGCVLYQMLTGRMTFAAPSVTGVLVAVATLHPPRPREVHAEVPPALDELVMRLLAKDPASRPASAAAVVEELLRVEATLANTDATAAVPASAVRVSGSTKRSRPWLLIGSALVIVALGVAAAQIVIKIRNRDGAETEIKVPDGATVEVARDGKTVAKVGPDAEKGSGEPLPPWKPPEPVPVGQSPFDRLDPKEIPAAERFAWQPRELVGLIGTHARRHWGCIPGAAISDDGTKAATVGSKENTTCLEEVIIWDLATQSPLRRFMLSPGDIAERLQFAEKDTRLYLFGHPSIQLWDIAADPPKHVPIPDPPRYVARYSGWFLEGGKTFCACDHDRSGDIALFALDGKGNPDGERRKISKVGHYWSVSCVAPSADLVVYAAPDSTLRLARVKNAKFADEETLPIKLLPNDFPRGLSPDGKELVVADDKGLAFWDIAARPPVERRRIAYASLPGTHHRVIFSPCGRWLVTRGDNGFVIWRADGPQPRRVAVLDANDAYIGDAAFSRDDNTLVTGNNQGLVRFWDLRGAEPKELSPLDPATAFARIDAHLTVVCFARQSAEVILPRFDLDPATKKPRWQTWALDSPKPRPTPGPEVFRIEPADNATRFWPVAGRKWLESPGWRSRQARLHAIVDGRWQQIGDPFGAPVLPGLVTPDGKLLVSLAGDGSVALEGWNVSGTPSKKWTVPHPVKRNEWPNRVIAASHDGSRFAVVTYPSAGATDLAIWRNPGAKPELQATLSLPQCWAHWYIAAMSPDGRLLAHSQATNTHEPEVLDLTGKEPRTIGRLPKVLGSIHWLAYAPNGRRLAAAGDRGVAVFDAKTLQLVWKWDTSPGPVYWLDWAADGRHLVTHNGNKTLYVLRLTELGK